MNPFVVKTVQEMRRNLESWCLDLTDAFSPVILLTFDQVMDQTDKPKKTDFEGTYSGDDPIVVTSVQWEAANILRVHFNIADGSPLEMFRYLGPLPSLKTLSGIVQDGFTLTTFGECGAKMLEDLKIHNPKKPYPPLSNKP